MVTNHHEEKIILLKIHISKYQSSCFISFHITLVPVNSSLDGISCRRRPFKRKAVGQRLSGFQAISCFRTGQQSQLSKEKGKGFIKEEE